MSQFRLFLFGLPRLEQDGQAIDITLRKALALLAYLAVTRQPHSRDALATLLWPDKDQRSSRGSLRRTLYQLNRFLRDELAVTAETIRLDPQARWWLDIEAFQANVAAWLPRPTPSGRFSAEALAGLTRAANLYTADFLAGFTLPDCPEFDEWQFFQAESLRRSLAHVLAKLVSVYRAGGEFEPAITYARRWLMLNPLHEPAQRQLMQLYDESGQPAAALRQYQECARLLEEELGLPPSEETITLYEAIKARHLLAPFVKNVREQISVSPAPRKNKAAEKTPLPAAPHPETRYVQSGQAHIAYQVVGQGEIDIVLIGGFVSHLEQFWEEPGLARFLQQLASFSRLILFDKRGVGLSDRVGYPPTLENTMDDVIAVMNAVGSQKTVVLGVSQGGPNAVLLAATYPERVSALILYGASARWLRSPDYPWGWTQEQIDTIIGRYTADWGGPVRLEYFAPSRVGDKNFRQWWAKFLRTASSPGGVKAVVDVTTEIDVRHVLPAIHVPTLVLHRTGDRIARLEAGRYLARMIPGAEFVELNGVDHFWWVGDSGAILVEIEKFLENIRQSPPPARMLATILAAEILDWMDGAYHPLIEKEIARFRGQIIKHVDRQILASFDGPSRAIQCVMALNTLAKTYGAAVRAGLHTGECEYREGKLGGVAIQIAAGVMAQAGPSEAFVSGTVKDLVVGAGFTFEARGACTLDDGLGAWPLFALECP